MPKTTKIDIVGKRFARLTVQWFLPDDKPVAKFWCLCDCGKEKSIEGQSLLRGLTQSCGCLQSERVKATATHGQSGVGRTRTYNSWAAMMDRCHWGGNKSNFAEYGAKGIFVFHEWHKFENFYAAMGDRPANTSLDRIDGTKGYGPGNCRWASRIEQALNRKNTVKVKLSGKDVPVFLVCKSMGLSRKAVCSRAHRRGGDYVAALVSMGVDCQKA